MSSASITFTEQPDGTIKVVVSSDEGGPLSKASMCAFALAKRGLTKREAERYGYPLFFTLDDGS